ncbi:hypothetical protein BUZ59_07610, partial [Staphylococcus kloosii]
YITTKVFYYRKKRSNNYVRSNAFTKYSNRNFEIHIKIYLIYTQFKYKYIIDYHLKGWKSFLISEENFMNFDLEE